MTSRAWRIVHERHAAAAFDGEGARRFGGRWSSPGVAVVYLAESRSLAMLEMLVHAGEEWPASRYVVFALDYEARDCERLDDAVLPKDWRRSPPPAALQAIGDEWSRSGRSAMLSVPSAIVPGEHNFLLSPSHPRFRHVVIGKPEPLVLDPRLARKKRS